MKTILMTREYPPHVYGGAGVHVAYLARHLAELAEVEVRCFGDGGSIPGNPEVHSFTMSDEAFAGNPHRVAGALAVLETSLHLSAAPMRADVVHCHTWYSMMAGILAKIGYGLPLVATVHSLEPLRPWKREQLGRGYDLSSWIERSALEMADAVIAVSESDRKAISAAYRVEEQRIRVIPNGVDCDLYRPLTSRSALDRHGVDGDRPYVLFVGRLSRQKGIDHFLSAIRHIDETAQAVLCAWPPDTAALADEVETAVAAARADGRTVVWIRERVPENEAVELYSHAAVFCCPSVYEPFGIINLEAMACETPVVASRVGGIVDSVVDGETGYLVDLDGADDDRGSFAQELATHVNRLLEDEQLRVAMGRNGRRRVAERFGWPAVARRVLDTYHEVAEEAGR